MGNTEQFWNIEMVKEWEIMSAEEMWKILFWTPENKDIAWKSIEDNDKANDLVNSFNSGKKIDLWAGKRIKLWEINWKKIKPTGKPRIEVTSYPRTNTNDNGNIESTWKITIN